MKNIMFVFAFERELLDHDSAGLKSYQALWMRIQNEWWANILTDLPISWI